MRIRGIVQSATLAENPPASDRIELILRVQGVGAGQPRTLVVPYELLLQDEALDPDQVARRRFEADVEQAGDGRWVILGIGFAERVLREPENP